MAVGSLSRAACLRWYVDSFSEPFSWHSMPLDRCSSAVISEARGAAERAVSGGRIVLAESLVSTDAGALPRLAASCGGEFRVRPRGASSDRWSASADGLLRPGDARPAWAGLAPSVLLLLASSDGLVRLLTMLTASSGMDLAEELEGRVGGEGGAPGGRRCA